MSFDKKSLELSLELLLGGVDDPAHEDGDVVDLVVDLEDERPVHGHLQRLPKGGGLEDYADEGGRRGLRAVEVHCDHGLLNDLVHTEVLHVRQVTQLRGLCKQFDIRLILYYNPTLESIFTGTPLCSADCF